MFPYSIKYLKEKRKRKNDLQEKQDLHVKRENSRCTNTLSGSFFTNCSAAYLQSEALRTQKTCIKLYACRNTLVKQPISN
jgi:hypothetical protein